MLPLCLLLSLAVVYVFIETNYNCVLTGTTDDLAQNLIKQMQTMKKQVQEQTYIIQRLLKRRGENKLYIYFISKT